MKGLSLGLVFLCASHYTLAGGIAGAITPRFAINASIGQASQGGDLNTGALSSQGYTNITSSHGNRRKSSAKLGLQYNFTPRWGMDVGAVQLGKNNYNVALTAPAGVISNAQIAQDVANAIPNRASKTSYYLGAEYRQPLTPRVAMTVGVGALRWKDNKTVNVNNNSYSFSTKGTDPYIRLGLGYRINQHATLMGNVERYNLDKPINRWDVGMAFRF